MNKINNKIDSKLSLYLDDLIFTIQRDTVNKVYYSTRIMLNINSVFVQDLDILIQNLIISKSK